MEESPEQVLARLARHRDSVYRARGIPLPAEPRGQGSVPGPGYPRTNPPLSRGSVGSSRPITVAPPIGAWVSTRPTPTEFLPPGLHAGGPGWQLTQSAVLVTIFGLLLAVVASAVAVFAFEELTSTTAFVIVGLMVGVGLIATARRVPAALWFTVGAAVGGALGRWS